jgi:Mg-chelatase subunit ChlD
MHSPRIHSHTSGALRQVPAILAVSALLACIVFPTRVSAQFQLILDKPDIAEYPQVHLPLQVMDNSASITALDTSNFTVKENGVVQFPLHLDCTETQRPQPINFVFILDRSKSMGFIEGTEATDTTDTVKWKNAKQVFVDSFRKLRSVDRGAFISFCRSVDLEQTFTSNVKLLEDAIAGLELCNGTFLYSALMSGVDLAKAQTGRSVIIVLTDGRDQRDQFHQHPDSVDVVDAAKAANIPIYSIGLGVSPLDVGVFSYLSLNTGGEYFIAPTSDQLAKVFSGIMKSIFTSRCTLTYTPSDTCRRGEIRAVEVTVRYGTSVATETTTYSVPDFRSRTRLAVEAMSFDDDQRVIVPLLIDGEVRANQALDFECVVRFDPSTLTYQGIDLAGGILDGQIVTTQVMSAGQVLFQGDAVMPSNGIPYGARDTLLSLVFDVSHKDKNEKTTISVSPSNFRQQCDMLSAGADIDLTVLGCPSSLRAGMDSLVVAPSGKDFSVAVILSDNIDVQQECRYAFSVSYDHSLISYAGFETSGTVSDGLKVSVVETPPGVLAVTAFPGLPAAPSGALLSLRFHASARLAAIQVPFAISGFSLAQSCVPATAFTGGKLFIDGACERMLVRGTSVSVVKIAPQPMSLSASDDMHVTVHLARAGRAVLSLTDVNGKQVSPVIERELAAGTQTITLPVQGRIPGTYILSLTKGGENDSKPLIITR